MICDDCKAVADFESQPGLAKVFRVVELPETVGYLLEGHERCRKAAALSTTNLRRETGSGSIRSYGCTCQHRT